MEKYTVKLTKEERESLLYLTKTGKHAASKILHARILLASDEGDYYKERHLIESFFEKIKYFRRIFSRFDKTAQAYMGFLNVAAIFIWLK